MEMTVEREKMKALAVETLKNLTFTHRISASLRQRKAP